VLNNVATKRTTWSFMIDREESANEFVTETPIGFIRNVILPKSHTFLRSA